MEVNLKKRKILLTGASRGIGEGIALQLGKAGATLALHYNSNEEKAKKIKKLVGRDSVTIKADLAKPEEAIALFEEAVKRLGRVDVLINNAGIAVKSPIEEKDEQWLADLDKTLQINLTSSAILCKKAINHFRRNKGGIIINISSRAAFRGDTSEYIAYAASKGGLVSLTKSIAKEFGKDGISAFNIAPGFVKTDMADQFLDEYGEEHLLNDLSLNRITEPKDLAPLITFLASGMAEHATGTTIDINAGSYLH